MKTFLEIKTGTTYNLYLCCVEKLSQHIEKLLLKHDCVIIPEFGGFIVNYESARFVPAKNLFVPASRKIGFNVHLTYNDGLLAQSFMQAEKCSYESAMKLIRQEVEEAKKMLKTNKQVKIGAIGSLSVNENNQLVFERNDDVALTPQYYGLKEIQYLPKTNIKTTTFPAFIWNVAAVVILFLLFLPVNILDNRQVEQASVISFRWNEPLVEPIVEDEIVKDIPIDSLFTENLDMEFTTESEVFFVEPKISYHIIIASLPSERLAYQYLQEIKEYNFNNTTIVNAENRYRISVKDFIDKSEAEFYLNSFKTEYPSFASAWVYTPKSPKGDF